MKYSVCSIAALCLPGCLVAPAQPSGQLATAVDIAALPSERLPERWYPAQPAEIPVIAGPVRNAPLTAISVTTDEFPNAETGKVDVRVSKGFTARDSEGRTRTNDPGYNHGGGTGLIELDHQVTRRARHFGFWHPLTSKATIVEPPYRYHATMIDGIFRSMQADHRSRSLPSGATELRDIFAIAAPLPILGSMAELFSLRRYMVALNRERNAVINRVAESDDRQRYLPAIRKEATQ